MEGRMIMYSFLKNFFTSTSSESMSLWQMMSPPTDISVNGHLIDWLFIYTTWMNVLFFALVCAGIFGFSYLYSAKRHPKPYYTYGNKKIHIMIATVIGLAVFVAVDMNITRISNNDYINVFANFPDDDDEDVLRVQVMAQQWMWNFRYAGADGIFNTEDDVITMNDLRLPIDRKIVFQIISKDVIHSFFLPNARQKVDAIPGRLTRMWVELTQPGNYDIVCAEMCGTFHYRMQAYMTVYTQEEFNEWMSEAERNAKVENELDNADLYWGWKWDL
jgi:cytochrome c oxidase subunit II